MHTHMATPIWPHPCSYYAHTQSLSCFLVSLTSSIPTHLIILTSPSPGSPPLSLFLRFSPPHSSSLPAFSSLIGLFRPPCSSSSSSSCSEGYKGFVWNTSPQRPHFNRLFILSLKQRMQPIGARVSAPGMDGKEPSILLHHNRFMRNAYNTHESVGWDALVKTKDCDYPVYNIVAKTLHFRCTH